MLRKAKVCILGAGASGLAAAHRLVDKGITDIIVVEAQGRVGGRVHTIDHGNHILELGAQWIHGEEGNVVYEWASKNGLTDEEQVILKAGFADALFVQQNGEFVGENDFREFQLIAANIDEEAEKEFANCSPSEDLGNFLIQKFKGRNTQGDLGIKLFEWWGRYKSSLDGSDNWFEVSAAGQEEYDDCPGNPVVNWKTGYRALLDHLKSIIPPSQLLLNSPVKEINWDCDSSKCSVSLQSGDVIEAEMIICTFSLAVLKKHLKTMFKPELPLEKVKAIEGLDIHVVDKIYLEFEDRWWGDCSGFSILRDIDNISDRPSAHNWEQSILGFYEPYKQRGILCAWLTGNAALAMEDTPLDEVARRCMTYLRKILSPKYSIPDPIWCERSAWGRNPYILGAYSYRSVKTSTMDVWARDLAGCCYNRHNKPALLFAGEATHDHFYSTVHGAVETGRREADRVINYIKSNTSSESKVKRHEVVIVGGGAAGIAAASQFIKSDVKDVVILEASDRLGGRILSVHTPPNSYVELGAQWIHGQVDNVLYDIGNKRDLVHHQEFVDGKGDFYTNQGEKLSPELVDSIRDVMEEADERCAELVDKDMSNTITPPSVGEFFKSIFDSHISTCRRDTDEVTKLKQALFHWFMKWHKIDNSCESLYQLSSRCWGEYKFCEGLNNMNPTNGMITLILALLHYYDIKTVLNQEVVNINYATEVNIKDGVVKSGNNPAAVIVTCRSGDVYYADHVVVTASVGFLKEKLHTLFTPQLPPILNKVISSIGFGVINKIFLEFEEKWWSDDCTGLHLVWTEDHLQESSSRSRSRSNNTCDWVKGITGFDPVFNQRAMLCGWIGGEEARYMELLNDKQVGEACVDVLRQFTANKNIPPPCRVFRSKWSSNEFIRGAYCYRPTIWDSNKCKADDLSTPVMAVIKKSQIKYPVLVLAGEANNVKHYSTVHGAVENGISQAGHYITAKRRLKKDYECIRKSKL